jgi:transposase-like protein
MITLEFERERTPPIVVLFATYLYLAGLAFSYRRVEAFLQNLRIRRSYEAVRQWVQRFGASSKGYFETGNAKVAVIDETKIKIGGQWYWLWIAIEPYRRKVLAMALTQTRNGLIARSLLKDLRRRYGRVSIITDGGGWYPWAARTLEMEHEVMSGGIRSYVERLIETVKDRIRVFDKYFPYRCGNPSHVSNFLRLFVLYYNHARIHQTLGEPPDPVDGETEFERMCNLLGVVKS